ncbi:LysM peptidoglycan-binding domain-containing protein [Tabrizicola sp.]|uniref:LysM peptidoglycan-binding domain-containing protein n=1 Tax=Tabrizicola sp. TaxID=2005166 RepID=UPI00262F822C|nr:LysM peptidoglycan-binding domain-containing protein [Tabrizicola sp.]MDM7930336.1 LysM peptidoglycan-binding domain-containing protein [Tabrizicola sp.]
MKIISDKYRSTALSAMLVALPAIASAQEACTTYTVKSGDTLGTIAQAAYGSYDYQMIFNANRDALAANPNNLPAGLQLVLPCEDGRLTADSELNSIIEQETQRQAAARTTNNSYEPPLKFVTSNDWAPFTDETLTGGGIFVRMAGTAMQRGGNDRGYNVSYVDDWMSHIEVLLPTGAFDVSIAWEAPDCTKLDLLGEFSVRMCTEFDFSLPIYETAYSFNTLADSKYANARAFSDYAGAKVCRPEAWPISDLEVQGLVEPLVSYVHPKAPLDCAEMLLKGEVDLYSIEAETSASNFKELNANDQVSANPALATFISYHFITAKSNPRGRVYIAMLNRGITEMRESGEWYDILATGLAEYNKLSQ